MVEMTLVDRSTQVQLPSSGGSKRNFDDYGYGDTSSPSKTTVEALLGKNSASGSVGCDDKLQSTQKRRRYHRRGSKVSSMLLQLSFNDILNASEQTSDDGSHDGSDIIASVVRADETTASMNDTKKKTTVETITATADTDTVKAIKTKSKTARHVEFMRMLDIVNDQSIPY